MNRWTVITSTMAVAIALFAAAACSEQGTAAPTPTATSPSTVAASPTPTNESGPGGIEGIVTGPEGRPAMGMRVAIVAGTAPFPEMSPETDGEGHYRLGGVSPGTFQVAVHSRGGERIGFQSVVVKSGETAMLNFSASVGTEDKAQGQPGPSGSPGKDTSPAATGGGTPRASLTYEGLAYYQDPLRTDEAASITKDDFELVGSTMESNTLAPGESLNIYKLKEGEEGCLYTLEPGHSFQNEDGATITIEAEWIRWTAGDSN